MENVASPGLAIDHPSGWFGGARLRHSGKAPLIEVQPPGEAQPVSDIHFQPVEPRTLRLTLRATF